MPDTARYKFAVTARRPRETQRESARLYADELYPNITMVEDENRRHGGGIRPTIRERSIGASTIRSMVSLGFPRGVPLLRDEQENLGF